VDFYARRLRKEEATRRLTILFVALAVVIQSLAVFSPPESANASSEQDIIRGGVSSKDDFVLRYDRNQDDLRDILTAAGITRADLNTLKQSTIKTSDNAYMLTRYGQLSTNEATLSYERSTGGLGVRFFTPLNAIKAPTSSFDGWIGTSRSGDWFAVVKANGSLALRTPPVATTVASVTKSVSAINLTKGSINAANTPAQSLDRIIYTLKVENTATSSQTTPLTAQLGDVLEYATLIDAGGATFNSDTSALLWPQVQLRPGETQERTFVVQLLGQLPSAPAGQSNPASYDCVLGLTFGDSSRVPVDCPTTKHIEGALLQLPTIGPGANILFGASILALSFFFYARTRQLKTELRIIRHNLITGIL